MTETSGTPRPFIFHTERRLAALTGLRAYTLQQLMAILAEVPGSSIFYHTHHQFLSHHFQKPVVYNDFARWVSTALLEEALAEKLSAIDLRAFTSLRQLREALLAEMAAHLKASDGYAPNCRPGHEFHFCKSKSFIMPTGLVARDPADFFAKLPRVSNISIYFHFLEARLRLARPINDFSLWLSSLGAKGVAEAIDSLDPYVLTLDELKQRILEEGRHNGTG